MSQPSSASPQGGAVVPVQKQKTNVYTVMLIIAFVCLVIACLLLALELSRWGAGSKPWNTSEATVQHVPPSEAAAWPRWA